MSDSHREQIRAALAEEGLSPALWRPVRAVQLGGPLGSYLSASQLDTPLTYEDMAGIGAMLGHMIMGLSLEEAT